jgi:ribosome-associated protein
MKKIKITSEYIKLDQFLKWIGLVGTGVEAKELILSGEVLVNDILEERRGRKLYSGDKVQIENQIYIVE